MEADKTWQGIVFLDQFDLLLTRLRKKRSLGEELVMLLLRRRGSSKSTRRKQEEHDEAPWEGFRFLSKSSKLIVPADSVSASKTLGVIEHGMLHFCNKAPWIFHMF